MNCSRLKITIKAILCIIFLFQGFVALSQNYNRFYEQGLIEYNHKNYFQAAKLFDQSHQIIPEISIITYKLAESLYFAHNYDRSLELFTEIITKYPGKYPLAYYYQADIQKTLKQYDEAESSFKYFYHNFSSETEFYKKSLLQIAGCDYALKTKNTSSTTIKKLASPINTFSSELSLLEINDSLLLYTSMAPNADSSSYSAKMNFNKHVLKFELLIQKINELHKNVTDLCLSSNQKTAFFCACTDTVGSNDFKIYTTVYDSMKWQKPELLPEPVNNDGYRSTQPFFTKINGKEYLFYASDCPGGQGNLDIWCSQWWYNRFLKPINLGNEINTIGDEITPFYDSVSNQLYFSSDMQKGYGGFDIFSSKINGSVSLWTQPVNLGLPFNSSFNDTYFTISQNQKRSYFTSDREPFKIDDNNYYFNDFYFFYNTIDSSKNLQLKDSLIIATSKKVENAIAVNTFKNEETNQIFTVYFDHNKPELQSKDNFERLLSEYLKNPESKKNEITDLQINKAFSTFTNRLKLLKEELKKGESVEIQFKAFTSPTGDQKYNQKLAIRRIESMSQYLFSFDSGFFMSYRKNIVLTILKSEIPLSLNNALIEDVQMAKQRKVEIKIVTKK